MALLTRFHAINVITQSKEQGFSEGESTINQVYYLDKVTK